MKTSPFRNPQQPRESSPAVMEQPQRPLHVADRALQRRGWKTIADLTADLRFPSEDACRRWLKREGIASVRRGRFILVDALDVDRALRNR